MSLSRWLRSIPRAIHRGCFPSNGLFLDEKSFRYELTRERVRVDRNGSTLAVLTIELPRGRATARDCDFLGRLLLRRLRISDTFGFLSERRVGVLLPDTTTAGAWKVASDICNVYPVGHDRPNCDVVVYPEEATTSRHERSSQHGRDTADEAAPASIDALLAEATPAWKRAFDIFGAIVGIIASAPLLLLCAIAIKVTSRGPVIYSQEREGFAGRRFLIYKLRTMRQNAERDHETLLTYSEQDGPAFKMRDDPRTTLVGRLLRKTSFDELPQLWNVLWGDMSLVGPRPLWIREASQCMPWQRQRLAVLPGLTCIWQVRGRNTVSFDEWMRMDIQYIRRRSILCDLQLLATTAPSIAFSRGPR
jgi:lipopolysaccharide/colanic/teichoic acid biosynthesis glycosyltransferase